MESLLAASAAIKVAFVEQDEREQGARKALNFGHTFAHALEKLSGWQIPHGQAVARGLSAECRLSESLGILPHGNLQRVRQLLAAYGLPDDPFDVAVGTHGKEPEAQLNAQSYLDATRGDKKVRGGMVEYVLLSAIGQVHRGKGSEGAWTHAVTDAQVVQALFSEGG